MKTLIVLVMCLVACANDKLAAPQVPAPIEIAARPRPAPSPIAFQGVVTSRASQIVTAPAIGAGVIKELRVKQGDTVEAGQLLAILDDPAQRALLAKMPKRSKARLAIEKRLAGMKIFAPIGGIVSSMQTTRGAIAKPGLPLFRISSTKRLQLRFALPTEQHGTIAKGMKVHATVAGRTTPIQAIVRSVGPADAPIRLAIVDAELMSGTRDTAGLYGALADVTIAPETR